MEAFREISLSTATSRTPVDLMGHTAYATPEFAFIPWPVMRHFLDGIQQTRDELAALTEELRRWHNMIPDGQERAESIRQIHEGAARPIEQFRSINLAVQRAMAGQPRQGADHARDS